MKLFYSMCCLLLAMVCSTTTALADNEKYGVNFEKNDTVKSKYVKSLTFNGQTLQVFDGTKPKKYVDMTSSDFIATAGAIVNFDGDFVGTWQQAYVYIDYNNDGEFAYTAQQGKNLKVPQDANSELVSYSGFGDNGITFNSNQEACKPSDNPNGKIPPFQLPYSLKAGDYRLRVKLDYNNLDPKGANTTFQVVDLTLHIESGDAAKYLVNFSKTAVSGSKGQGNYHLKSFTLGDYSFSVQPEIDVNKGWPVYYDLTAKDTVTFRRGAEVSVDVDYTKPSWLAAYLFIDWDKDGIFSNDLDSVDAKNYKGETIQRYFAKQNAELVTFFNYRNYDSKGNWCESNLAPNGKIPSFLVPRTREVRNGSYRARLVLQSQESNDPGGYIGSDYDIRNVGVMVDFVFQVGTPTTTGVISAKSEADNANAPVYNLQGQRVTPDRPGIYIRNGKKFVVK